MQVASNTSDTNTCLSELSSQISGATYFRVLSAAFVSVYSESFSKSRFNSLKVEITDYFALYLTRIKLVFSWFEVNLHKP